MSFQIEKGVTPPKRTGNGAARKYPFDEMKTGDSFLINGDTNWRKVATAASAHGKRYGQKFSTRNTSEGYRCWRVA